MALIGMILIHALPNVSKHFLRCGFSGYFHIKFKRVLVAIEPKIPTKDSLAHIPKFSRLVYDLTNVNIFEDNGVLLNINLLTC